MFEETLFQKARDGTQLVDVLKGQGIVPGIKVDTGLQPLPGTDGETATQGLDGLADRCKAFYEQGARFAKWRAVIKVGLGLLGYWVTGLLGVDLGVDLGVVDLGVLDLGVVDLGVVV